MISDAPIIQLVQPSSAKDEIQEIDASTGAPEMSGPEKAAILLISIGLELSASIFKFLRQDEVERIVLEIAKISTVPIEKRDAVVNEVYRRAIALKYINEGGIEYANQILEKSFGAGHADNISSKVMEAFEQDNPLEVIKKTEPAQILELVQNEHPQTVALILAYMSTEQAGPVLSALAPDLQAEVAMRIAILQKTAPEVLEQLDEFLGRRLMVANSDVMKVGGVATLAKVMGYVDRDAERNIFEGLGKRDPELLAEVKNLLFLFEDIINLDDRSIQRVLKEVDGKDLTLALRGSNEELLARVFKNMSQRAGQALKEDIEILGPTPIQDIEKAQQSIVTVIRELEADGQIVIARGAKEQRLV